VLERPRRPVGPSDSDVVRAAADSARPGERFPLGRFSAVSPGPRFWRLARRPRGPGMDWDPPRPARSGNRFETALKSVSVRSRILGSRLLPHRCWLTSLSGFIQGARKMGKCHGPDSRGCAGLGGWSIRRAASRRRRIPPGAQVGHVLLANGRETLLAFFRGEVSSSGTGLLVPAVDFPHVR